MSNRRVIVIGAGIAGLSAAYDLQTAGCEVKVLEKDSFAGGRMADIQDKNLNIHSGATICWTFYDEMMDLIKRVGLEDDIHYWQRPAVAVDNGEMVYELKYHFDIPFMTTHPALSIKTKLKLVKLLPDMISAGLKTDPNLMHTAAHLDDESIAEYVERLVGTDFLENYIEPLFRAPWNWEPEQISKAYLLPILGHLMGARTFSFKQGIGQLTRNLADRLDVRLGCAVQRVAKAEPCSVEYQVAGRSESVDCDAVVIAVTGTHAPALVPELADDDRRFFDSVEYTPCGIVYYLLNTAPPEYTRWYTRKHPSDIVYYAQNPTDDLVPPGHSQPPHLYCELTPEVNARIIADGATDNLDRYARPQASTFYPELEEQLVDVVEQWIDEMLPKWYPGYARKVAGFLEKQERSPGKVYFCGDYLSHSHTGGACASGRRIARTVLNHWQAA